MVCPRLVDVLAPRLLGKTDSEEPLRFRNTLQIAAGVLKHASHQNDPHRNPSQSRSSTLSRGSKSDKRAKTSNLLLIWCFHTGSSPPSRFPRRSASYGAITIGTNGLASGFYWQCTANAIGYTVSWSQHAWTPNRLPTSTVWVHPDRKDSRECDDNDDCEGTCCLEDGTCSDLEQGTQEIGDDCEVDCECVSGLCFEGQCNEAQGTQRTGESCDIDCNCISGICVRGRCSLYISSSGETGSVQSSEYRAGGEGSQLKRSLHCDVWRDRVGAILRVSRQKRGPRPQTDGVKKNKSSPLGIGRELEKYKTPPRA